MKTLYCLKMETPGRWYVGQTPVNRFPVRLDEHRYYGGAKWTTKHGVSCVEWKRAVPDSEADRLEDLECAKIMAKHGINSCRGGLFNIKKDVQSMPSWAGPEYRERRAAISQASGREI